MTTWLRRIRGAVGMGLTWALGWAVAGVFFSAVLGIAGRGQRIGDLSLPRFALWGVIGGILLIGFPFALVAFGLASREGSALGIGQILSVITGPFVLLSSLSAGATLRLARIAEERALRAGADAPKLRAP